MPITTQTFKEVPPELLTLLLRFLPESLTVLRRLQFIKITTIQRPHGQIIFCSSDGPLSDTAANTINSFTVSYLDIAGGPDTQMWLFSTLQCRPSDSQETAQCKEQLDALVQQVTSINKAYGKPLHYGDSVVLGSLENHVRALFQIEKLVTPRPSGNYDKWVLNLDDIPASNDALPEGMVWGTGSLDDCKLVASRTDIPRPPYVLTPRVAVAVLTNHVCIREFLVQLQNYFIKLEDGTPVAWAFLGES